MEGTFVFGGSSNRQLTEKIAKLIHGRVGKAEISRFVNEEAKVWVREDNVGHQVVVVQSFSSPVDSHIIEFTLLCDALRRVGAHQIIAVIPWLAYSKQDKVFRAGEPLSVKVIAKILQVVPLQRIYTFDLHNLAILGFFEVPVTNLTAKPLFVEYFRKFVTDQTVVVAPDAGSIKISTSFASDLNVPVAYVDKKRDLRSGKVSISGISRSVAGTHAVIIDDMIVTGDTLVETAKFLKKERVRSIVVGATHNLNVPGVMKRLQDSDIDEIVVTDTIEPKDKLPKLTILSVSDLIAREIVR